MFDPAPVPDPQPNCHLVGDQVRFLERRLRATSRHDLSFEDLRALDELLSTIERLRDGPMPD